MARRKCVDCGGRTKVAFYNAATEEPRCLACRDVWAAAAERQAVVAAAARMADRDRTSVELQRTQSTARLNAHLTALESPAAHVAAKRAARAREERETTHEPWHDLFRSPRRLEQMRPPKSRQFPAVWAEDGIYLNDLDEEGTTWQH